MPGIQEVLGFANDDRFFENNLALIPVCGGPCVDMTWTADSEGIEKILDWFESKPAETRPDPKKLREVLEKGGEIPIKPYGEYLAKEMPEILGFGEPDPVQHGSQGLNVSIQADKFGFNPVLYNHSISSKNLLTLLGINAGYEQRLKRIGCTESTSPQAPSITVNIRSPDGEVNAYLSDAVERNYKCPSVRKHLESAEVRIRKALAKREKAGVLVADIQVLGHSLSDSEFKEYLQFMEQVMIDINRLEDENSERVAALVDCGGLNAYDDATAARMYSTIYQHAPILGCNEAEAIRLSKVIWNEHGVASSDPIECANHLADRGTGDVWLHTRDGQTYITKDTSKDPNKILKALTFSNLTAGLSLEQQQPITLQYIQNEIRKGEFSFRDDEYKAFIDYGKLTVQAPSLDIQPKSEIQAGDRAGTGLIYGLLKF